MAVGPSSRVRKYPEVSQMEAETEMLIYKLVSYAKMFVLSLQKKIKTWGDKYAPLPPISGGCL